VQLLRLPVQPLLMPKRKRVRNNFELPFTKNLPVIQEGFFMHYPLS
jgi:hypothetical protein